MIKKITTEISYFGERKNGEVKEENQIVCPLCEKILYIQKKDEIGRASEIAKKVWQSL